jgi:hypothetical protein
MWLPAGTVESKVCAVLAPNLRGDGSYGSYRRTSSTSVLNSSMSAKLR